MAVNVLLIGGGGREHALAWKLRQSSRLGKLYVAPGNAGTSHIAENVAIPSTNFERLAHFAKEKAIDLTVVGPDDPLALGIVDFFHARDLRIWGPTMSAARIEASKAFSKSLMREAGIPTAGFEVFDDYEQARVYLSERPLPIVVKASGLALGKGVYVCHTRNEAEAALSEIMLEKVHKDAGETVVIEEFLDGPEISIHALSDGATSVMFPASQDHKPIGEGNTGKNTGGMGTISSKELLAREILSDVKARVVDPTLRALGEGGAPFKGLLYPGLKMSTYGMRVLEFNARFGDPETQVYMRLLDSDLVELLEACVDGTLEGKTLAWRDGYAVNVVLASRGYPDAYQKGFPITGIEEAEKVPSVVVFHAGTMLNGGTLVTNGGRVLGVSALGETLEEARERAYEAITRIHFEGIYYRRDIGAAMPGA